MAQNITVHVDELVAAAEREIETLSAADAIKLHGSPDVVLVDIRDPRELGRLLEHPHGESLAAERERGREAAESAAGDQNG